jgi:hypothetical protein
MKFCLSQVRGSSILENVLLACISKIFIGAPHMAILFYASKARSIIGCVVLAELGDR